MHGNAHIIAKLVSDDISPPYKSDSPKNSIYTAARQAAMIGMKKIVATRFIKKCVNFTKLFITAVLTRWYFI
jgi:hypothetical protein